MDRELFTEQNNAFLAIKKAIRESKKRAPIFIYGKKGVGKKTIIKKVIEEDKNSVIISVNKLIRSMLTDETVIESIQNDFLLKHSPEQYLEILISKFNSKDIIIISELEYLISNKISNLLMVNDNYDFGRSSDFAMNKKLIWIFMDRDFKRFKKHWELTNSPLNNCNCIEVLPPSEQSLRSFIKLYQRSDDFVIDEHVLNKSLQKGYYYFLIKRYKNKLRL